jgi:hypothetical protein
MFLSKTDFNAVAKDSTISQIAQGNFPPPQLVTSERFAIDEAKSYLNFKYNTDVVFGVNAYDFDAAQAYKIGEVVMDVNGNPYNCIADAPLNTPLTDTNYFAEGDLRNSLVVMILVDMTVYHFHSRTAGNRIPEMRIVRYEQAIEKLKEIRKSNMNPNLPLRDYDAPEHTSQQETHTLEIISQDKRNNNY